MAYLRSDFGNLDLDLVSNGGGLADAVSQGLKEQGLDNFELKAVSCDGIEECRIALLKKSKNLLEEKYGIQKKRTKNAK